jgi:hypothetical protein
LPLTPKSKERQEKQEKELDEARKARIAAAEAAEQRRQGAEEVHIAKEERAKREVRKISLFIWHTFKMRCLRTLVQKYIVTHQTGARAH